VSDTQTPDIDAAAHRRLAIDLFNRSWELLELAGRTPAQDDELIHTVHASCYHWRVVGTPANLARGENQCARVYAALGRPEAALHHASRALELVRAGGDGLEDWDLASALEVAARAHLAAGNRDEAERYAAQARAELETVADPEDREVIGGQLDELGL
jgi:tetratricopeptide (TPR) repeat protein